MMFNKIESLMVIGIVGLVTVGASFCFNHINAKAYSQSIGRTSKNIVREFGRKDDFSTISLESAKKFTTVPDIVSNITPHTSLTPNDGFVMAIKASRSFCESWIDNYSEFNETTISGRTFSRAKTIEQAKEMIHECRPGLNEISLIYIRPASVSISTS